MAELAGLDRTSITKRRERIRQTSLDEDGLSCEDIAIEEAF